ncbi:MAG: PKD domain-containing protein [Terriglobales bacterium]
MRSALLACLIVLSLAATAFAGTLQIVPTTTLAAETGNNTSASGLWITSGNGDLGAGNVSKVDTHTLLYPGFSGKIYAHLMGWFCMNAGSTAVGAGTSCSSHVQIGYNSNDPAVVQAQVNDMISRGFDGVIHDWYGPNKTADDIETRNYMAEAQLHPNFTFSLMVDKGAIQWYSCYSTCTATQALTQIMQYAASTFFNSPAYTRINGRPVVTSFGLSAYSIDWNYVAANTPGNPIFLFQNNGGFTATQTGGGYAWIQPTDPNYGLDYLASFYTTGLSYPALQTVGATYKGFNDTLASWSSNRIMSQQCGQTWLQTFAQANSQFNSSTQLPTLQLVTWDDYEEGTEIESGIDNCFSVNTSVSGSVLNWSISGDETTIDHYTVFLSTDGQNLMSLGDFAAGTRQLDLSTFSLSAGAYTMFVKAVGKPSFRNQMSAAVTYSAGAPAVLGGVTISSPTTGSSPSSPVQVLANATADSGQTITSTVVYLDNNMAYQTSASSVNTMLAATPGSHSVACKATDGSGKLYQAAPVSFSVPGQPPTAALSLSATSGTAPVSITASTSGSTDPNIGGSIATSSINWGDGSTSTGSSASHTYNTTGSYTVTATVTDNYGLSASTSKTVTVGSLVTGTFITSPASGASVNSPVQMVANTVPVAGQTVSAMIVYVDYNEVYRIYNSSTVNTAIPLAPGSHFVVVNAWDGTSKLYQSSKVTFTVLAQAPLAALSLSATSAYAPATITASTSASTDPNVGGSISTWTITWGDGTTSAGPSASHTYNNAGTYNVTATVTDNYGKSSTASQTLTVNAQLAGVFISAPVTGATTTSPVPMSAKAVAISGQTITTMIVYVDYNEVYRTYSATVSTSVPLAPGSHFVVINAWDGTGKSYQSSKVTFAVAAQAPVAALSVSVSGATATASTSGSTDPNVGGSITSSTIAWGDGASSAGPSASHTYAASGTYTITATVTDNYGLSATTSTTVTATTFTAGSVTILAPASGSKVGSPVQVTATATADTARTIVTSIVYLDYNQVYKTSSGSVSAAIPMTSGNHFIVINAWDNLGKIYQSKKVTFSVR